jgi:NADP-dependent 3-hydroxy acid dehydrogenase YdfG
MKTILISGTSRGLGQVTAEYFLSKGWQVIGVSRSLSSISHNRYTHYLIDITDYRSVNTLFNTLPQIDVLVNNSAVFVMKKFIDTDIADIDSIIDTNLKGAMYVTKCALKLMHTGSKIIFINSVAGIHELANQSVYCASKHGLKSFAGVLGNELRSQKIAVCSIHPGGINTTLWNNTNPYPNGDVTSTTDPIEISEMIFYIVDKSSSTQFKTVVMFPEIEWH